jgi:hypothetical protein
MSKSVPLSFRASAEEAEFLSLLQVQGASTPSEKLRWLLQMARNRSQQSPDAAERRAAVEELVRSTAQSWRRAEAAEGQQSVLIRDFVEWVTEAVVFLAAPRGGQSDPEFLKTLEEGAALRSARIAEQFLRLGVTRLAPCHDAGIVRKHTGPLVELVRIIDKQREGDDR